MTGQRRLRQEKSLKIRMMSQARVGLVGAGFIAAAHIEALRRVPGVEIGAVIDPNVASAARLAGSVPQAKTFASLAEAIEARAVDRVHILAPPQLHASLTVQALDAGLPILVEKPLGVTPAEVADLVRIAQTRGTPLGVNQNFMFDPLLLRFARELAAGKFGRLRHVSALCAVPLRQLAAKQFGHWMFERPSNIVLEQMVHPLSQLVRLLGRLTVTSAATKPAVEITPGLTFHHGFEVSFRAEHGTAQLHMAFAENFPAWHFQCLCDDALVILDFDRGQILRYKRTRFLEQGDVALVSAAAGLGLVGQAAGGLLGQLGAQLKLVQRRDAFFRSMLASIQEFHGAVDKQAPVPVDGSTGAHLVDLCADVVRLAGVSTAPAPRPKTLVTRGNPVPEYDVAVLGGTGFIGKATVEQLVAAGHKVGVMARGMRGLPAVFENPAVTLLEGDVTNSQDIARAIGSAKAVVNLAHGGASGSRETIVKTIVGSAETVANACLAAGVGRLIHVSSIAALYLGDPNETITSSTPADDRGAERGDYSFAKAEAERLLLAMHRAQGLPVTIQRPGVVVGEGASPFHSGLGLFNNEQHCLGWSDGRNPLAFVLVEDCAAAIVCALKADDAIHGRADNIVGPVRLTAREYIGELAHALGRPLVFHPRSVWRMQAIEVAKWLVKRAGGRAVPFPGARDLRSRGMLARFDTAATEATLAWRPLGDRAKFIERGIRVPARALLFD